MTCWSRLPTDILDIVFEYLLKDLDEKPTRFRTHYQTKDIQRCQQTCKSWARTAQMKLYEKIVIYNLHRAELLIHTLRKYNLGFLVKTIAVYLRRSQFNTHVMRFLLPKIGYFCSDLKKLRTDYYFPGKEFCECIQVVRSKGSFSKLQAITPPPRSEEYDVTPYYKAAYSLRETLRELTIYVGKLAPIENLENFTNIDTLYFKLESSTDIYTLDQQIKICPTVEFIGIELMKWSREADTNYLQRRDIKTSSLVNILPQVKQLFVRNITLDNRLCGYLMNVFPNLNKLDLHFDLSANSRSLRIDKMSNNTAQQFLSYLMKMTSASVNYFPVEDVDDLLMNFQDINGMNKHLSVTYKEQSTSFINLKVSANKKIDIEVTNLECKELFYLPRLGMIEKSGRKIQSLTVNMNCSYYGSLEKEIGASYSGTDLYHILFFCPNLKNVCIMNTSLPCFSTHQQEKLRLSLGTFNLRDCFFKMLYLHSLSYHVNYINTLTIQDVQLCRVKKILFINKVINMPETEFYSINYHQEHEFCRIFLKLEKTVDNSVGWFVSKNNGLERCTEGDYEAYLDDKFYMSVFICCVDIHTIKLSTRNIKAIFKSATSSI